MKLGRPRGKVLVLGTDSRALLAVVRSLGRAGIQVHVAGERRDPITARSRYVRAIHVLDAYRESHPAWLEALAGLMARERFDLVLPLNDAWVTALQLHRDVLEPLGRLYILDDVAFDTLFNKIRTNELARQLGIPVPRERVVSNIEDLVAFADWNRFPLVLKPPVSHNDHDPGTRNTVRYVHTPDDLRPVTLELLPDWRSVAIQEYFVGIGVGVELLLYNGEPLLAFQHQRIHEPLHGGGSSYRKSVPLAPHLLDASLRLLRHVNYTGVAMVEFRVNDPLGTWVLIEVNARFWGSLPLALAAGVNFPLALYRLLVEGPSAVPHAPIRPHQPRQPWRSRTLYARNLTRDLAWYREHLHATHAGRGRKLMFLAKEMLSAGARGSTLRERIDTWAIDDPQPLVAEVSALLETRKQARRRARDRSRLESQPERAKRSAAALNALASARSVLFVCKGNICRSPFAEQLAHQQWPSQMRITSAGYYPRAGRPPTDLAVQTAQAWGVDLSAHRSLMLTPTELANADVVFVFDQDNYERLAHDYPAFRHHIHLLGALTPNCPLLIEDPYGGSAETYTAVYTQIAGAIAVTTGHVSKNDSAAESTRAAFLDKN